MKSLRDCILEGAWSYSPSDGNDNIGDRMDDLCDDFIKNAEKTCVRLNKEHDGNSSWTVIGIVDNLYKMLESINRCGLLKGTKILAEYKAAIDFCVSDTVFIDSWDEPNEIRAELEAAVKRFGDYTNNKR